MQDLHSEKIGVSRVRIVKTTPAISEQALGEYSRCYMGISLDNPVFYGKSLQTLLAWICNHFEECLIIVGDYLRRYNEQLFNGHKNELAEMAAMASGDKYINETKNTFDKFSKEKIHLTRWKDYLATAQYKHSRAELESLYTENTDFRAALQKDAFAFIKRQAKHNQSSSINTKDAIEMCCQYLLEEIAVFDSLAIQGWQVEVYPGPELNVLVEAAKGNYASIPKGLSKRINIELKVTEDKAQQ